MSHREINNMDRPDNMMQSAKGWRAAREPELQQ